MKIQLKYFTEDELVCPCCKEHGYSDVVLGMLDNVRRLYGSPMVITSAARCEAYNKTVGGSETSSHLFNKVLEQNCTAFDVACYNSNNRGLLIKTLMNNGFNRIGINPKKKFIHFDCDVKKIQPVIWIYE